MRFFITLLTIFLVLQINLFSQKHDYIWLMGYAGGELSLDDPTFGITRIEFSDFGKVDTLNDQQNPIGFGHFSTMISNGHGELQFFSNGADIWDLSPAIMLNGEGINIPDLPSLGVTLPQGGIATISGIENEYFFFHETKENIVINDDPEFVVTGLFYSKIDMSDNSNLGSVTLKKEELVIDTLHLGKLKINKHANGKDWWLLVNEWNKNSFYTILITDDGPTIKYVQEVGQPLDNGVGQAVFSPDGSKYAIFNTISSSVGVYVNIYDFDRCTGELSNPIEIWYPHNGVGGGVSISPNNRFLYVTSNIFIYQYDLWAEDVEASRVTVAEYNGFADPFPVTFYQAQSAPDGKIYISATNGTFRLSVIQHPDRKGLACEVDQAGFVLPTRNAFSIPNFPNYRLGPLDGSPCDTLGLDNLPLANYRADQDTTDYLDFYFQDLSSYEPEDWFWDFGDGTTSQDTSPYHVFPGPGIYPVCLTVSNEYGSDTACDSLYLGVTDVGATLSAVAEVSLFPNPVQDRLTLVMNDYYPRAARLRVYTLLGQLALEATVRQGWQTIPISELASGAYFYEVVDGSQRMSTGRLLKE